MTPFGPPAPAERRFETYVGGGKGLAEEGVRVNVYVTDSSNEGEKSRENYMFTLHIIAENYFHGNFATECIPVTIGRRSVNGSPGRQERSDYEHLVYVGQSCITSQCFSIVYSVHCMILHLHYSLH